MSSKLIILQAETWSGSTTRMARIRVGHLPRQHDIVHFDDRAYRVNRVHLLAESNTPDVGNPHHHRINTPGPERPVGLVEAIEIRGERALNAGADLRAEQVPSRPPEPPTQEPNAALMPGPDRLPSREMLVDKLRKCKEVCDGQRKRIDDLIKASCSLRAERNSLQITLDDAERRLASMYKEHQALRDRIDDAMSLKNIGGDS